MMTRQARCNVEGKKKEEKKIKRMSEGEKEMYSMRAMAKIIGKRKLAHFNNSPVAYLMAVRTPLQATLAPLHISGCWQNGTPREIDRAKAKEIIKKKNIQQKSCLNFFGMA